MKEKILKFLPWILLIILIILSIFNKNKNLKDALRDLDIAKKEIDSAKYNMDESLNSINQLKDSLNAYILNTEAMNLKFKAVLDSLNRELKNNQRIIESYKNSLRMRESKEIKNRNRTEVIHN